MEQAISGSPPAVSETDDRVILFEPETLIRELLVRVLNEMGYDSHACAETHDFWRRLSSCNPQVAIVDLASESASEGVEMVRRLHDAHTAVRPVVLLSGPDAGTARRYLANGAALVVARTQVGPRELDATLHSLGANKRPDYALNQTLLRALSRREREVLGHLGRGYDNLKIAALMNIRERTVRAHTAALYAKLATDNRIQLALIARDFLM